MKSKVYIENLKKYPEMVDKLLNLYWSTWLSQSPEDFICKFAELCALNQNFAEMNFGFR
jgi:hypothetical protein